MQSTHEDIVPTPLSWPSHLPALNSTEYYFHKQQLCTALITVYTVVEPSTVMSLAPTEDNMNMVEKIDTQLTCMEQDWAKTQSGPFPKGI
jgi:hypothetical protein